MTLSSHFIISSLLCCRPATSRSNRSQPFRSRQEDGEHSTKELPEHPSYTSRLPLESSGKLSCQTEGTHWSPINRNLMPDGSIADDSFNILLGSNFFYRKVTCRPLLDMLENCIIISTTREIFCLHRIVQLVSVLTLEYSEDTSFIVCKYGANQPKKNTPACQKWPCSICLKSGLFIVSSRRATCRTRRRWDCT